MNQLILHEIPDLSSILLNKKCLLVRSKSFDKLPILDSFKNINYVEFSKYSPNPLYEQVVEGVEVFKRNKCDAIISVGGGSTIDVGKCIKLFSVLNSSLNYLSQEFIDSSVLHITIPTTAGTGSESTRHAVIYYDGIKQSIFHDTILPDIAILEPKVLKSLPIYQKKCTLLDALSQSIESIWSINSTDESACFAKMSIDIIKNHWREYIFQGTNESNSLILDAANYSGRAINISATTAAHAMSYKLSSIYGIPHGHAVALCLASVWNYMLLNSDLCVDPRGESHFLKSIKSIPVDIGWYEKLLLDLQIEKPKSINKISDLEILSNSVNSTRLKNNPVILTKKTIYNLYEDIIL